PPLQHHTPATQLWPPPIPRVDSAQKSLTGLSICGPVCTNTPEIVTHHREWSTKSWPLSSRSWQKPAKQSHQKSSHGSKKTGQTRSRMNSTPMGPPRHKRYGNHPIMRSKLKAFPKVVAGSGWTPPPRFTRPSKLSCCKCSKPTTPHLSCGHTAST